MGLVNIIGAYQDPLNLDQGAGKLVNVRVVPRQPTEGKPGPVRLVGAPGLTQVCWPTPSPCIAICHALGTIWSGHANGQIYYGVETGAPTLSGSVAVDPVLPVIRMAEDRTALAIASNRNVLGSQYYGTAYTATQAAGVVNAGFDSSINFDPSAVAELDNMTIWAAASNSYINQSDRMYRSQALAPATVNGNWWATKEARADRIVDLAVSGRVVWPLGARSLEQWYDAADGTDFPFTAFPNTLIEVGIAVRTTLASLRGSFGFVGTDKRVWKCEGQSGKPISPPWVDLLLQQLTQAQLSTLTSYAYGQGGSDFYVLTLPGSWTIELAVNTGIWSYKQSFGRNDHAGRCATEHDGGVTYVGLDTGQICTLDFNSANEPAGRLTRTIISPWIGDEETRTTINYIDVTSSMGPAAGNFTLDWSLDGEQVTWRGARQIVLPQPGVKRAIARQLGTERRRQVRLQYSGSQAPFSIDQLYAGITPGQ
jgi:hypothetical protein